MTWNHRVFSDGLTPPSYVIREVFYEEGKVIGCTENPVSPYGESLDELREDLKWFLEATNSPVLTMEDIPRPFRPILEGGARNAAGLPDRWRGDKDGSPGDWTGKGDPPDELQTPERN